MSGVRRLGSADLAVPLLPSLFFRAHLSRTKEPRLQGAALGVLKHDIEPRQGAADFVPVDERDLMIERALGQLAEIGFGLPEQVAQLGFRAAQQFVGSQHLHILLHQFWPRRSRPSGGGLATEEAGASLATGTSEEECFALAPTQAEERCSLAGKKDGRGCGGDGGERER